jgi:hypothetical protein
MALLATTSAAAAITDGAGWATRRPAEPNARQESTKLRFTGTSESRTPFAWNPE